MQNIHTNVVNESYNRNLAKESHSFACCVKATAKRLVLKYISVKEYQRLRNHEQGDRTHLKPRGHTKIKVVKGINNYVVNAITGIKEGVHNRHPGPYIDPILTHPQLPA